MAAPVIKLNNGYTVPVVGLGTWKSGKDEVKNAVITAIKNGYRHIDTATAYGNECEVGEALKECIPSICKREEIFITTKIWPTDLDEVEEALNCSLKRLGLDYLDLYLVHWPVRHVLKCPKRDPNDFMAWFHGFDAPHDIIPYSLDWFISTWRALEKCVEKGLTKSIGLSNFSPKRIDELLKVCKIKPVMNQIELHPGLCQHDVIKYCLSHDIQVTAYCPLGRPDRPDSNDPNSYSPLQHPSVIEISKKYNKTPGQILLRWGLQRNTIIVPKSVNEQRIKDNISLFDFEMTSDDISEIDKLDCNYRISPGAFLVNTPEDIKNMWE